eukprot:751473-Hanusia_phi.AAC.4
MFYSPSSADLYKYSQRLGASHSNPFEYRYFAWGLQARLGWPTVSIFRRHQGVDLSREGLSTGTLDCRFVGYKGVVYLGVGYSPKYLGHVGGSLGTYRIYN